MPESEQQDKTLSEIVVKEAVGLGMDSPMRDSILEAVEESDGSTGGKRNIPLAGALFAAGAALGFLAGRESPDLEDTALEDIQEPEIIEDVVEETTEAVEEAAESGEETTTETASETDEGGSSRLSRLLLAVGLLAGIAVLRRRVSSGEEEEWEPIEEFEPATSDEFDSDTESEAEEAEVETDESDVGTDETDEE